MAMSQNLQDLLLAAIGSHEKRDELVILLNNVATLSSGNIVVGNGSNTGASVALSGDATLSNSGALTIAANAVTVGKISTQLAQYNQVNIASAAVLTLNTAPVVLVPAPGAGLVNIVQDLWVTYVFGTAAYACNAAGASLFYKSDASGQAVGITVTQAFIQSASGTNFAHVRGGTSFITDVTANMANQPIVIKASTSNPTTGDGIIKFLTYYRVVPAPLV